MAQPVTTTDILLQEIAASLVEIRDLLQEQSAGTKADAPAPAPAKPAAKRARSTAKK